jgi:hypothetical protein
LPDGGVGDARNEATGEGKLFQQFEGSQHLTRESMSDVLIPLAVPGVGCLEITLGVSPKTD